MASRSRSRSSAGRSATRPSSVSVAYGAPVRPIAETTTTGDAPASSAAVTRAASAARPGGVGHGRAAELHDDDRRAQRHLGARYSPISFSSPTTSPLVVADLAHGEHDAGHEAAAVDGVVADRERLALSAEEDLLVRHEAGQPHRVHVHAVHERAAGALGRSRSRGRGRPAPRSAPRRSATRCASRCRRARRSSGRGVAR